MACIKVTHMLWPGVKPCFWPLLAVRPSACFFASLILFPHLSGGDNDCYYPTGESINVHKSLSTTGFPGILPVSVSVVVCRSFSLHLCPWHLVPLSLLPPIAHCLFSLSSLHNLLLFLFPLFKAEPRVVCLWLLWTAEFFGLGPGPSLTTRLGPAHLALPGLSAPQCPGPGPWDMEPSGRAGRK